MKTRILLSSLFATLSLTLLGAQELGLREGAPGQCTIVTSLSPYRNGKLPDLSQVKTEDDAYNILAGFPSPTVEVELRLKTIWNLGAGRRADALHEWMEELSQDPSQMTDEAVYYIRRALLLWCEHYCEKETNFFYRHIYNHFLRADERDFRHLQHFLDLERYYDFPEPANALLVLLDAINGESPENLEKLYPLKKTEQFHSENYLRIFQDPELNSTYLERSGEKWEQLNCRQAKYDCKALLEAHAHKGITHWGKNLGSELPKAIAVSMQLVQQRLEGKLPSQEQVKKIIELA